jgi:oleate hydratase
MTDPAIPCWEKLAARNPKFGNPAAFLSNIDKTNWISFFATIKGDRTFYDFMEAKSGDKAGTGGAMTVVDSSGKISFVLYSKYFPNQPDDVNVSWAYGQCSNVPGDFVKKPMEECTGAEMFAELLYHCGLKDKIDGILAHSQVSTAVMPYITSQFMPRKIGDRPKVIPQGCVNLAFMGQFVELPLDVVFTVETSVRTALMAVWGLTGLQKPMIPVYEPAYDVRVIVANLKASLGIDEISLSTLPRILRSAPSLKLIASRLKVPVAAGKRRHAAWPLLDRAGRGLLRRGRGVDCGCVDSVRDADARSHRGDRSRAWSAVWAGPMSYSCRNASIGSSCAARRAGK